jgi:hypothetical protein
MPQIIVAADRGAAFGQGAVTLREGVSVADFQSEHFASQLVERLGWAVEDADQLEQAPGEVAQTAGTENTEKDLEPARGEPAEDLEPTRRERAEDREPVTVR